MSKLKSLTCSALIADQLMDGGADAGQLDDIGVRQEGEATEIRVRILPEFGFLIMQCHATDSAA